MSSTLLCGALNLCIPARNAVDLNGGKASCRMSARQSTVANAFRGWGCSDRDAALSINMALCAAFPCMAIFWRRCDIHPIVISGSRSLFRGGSRANISIFIIYRLPPDDARKEFGALVALVYAYCSRPTGRQQGKCLANGGTALPGDLTSTIFGSADCTSKLDMTQTNEGYIRHRRRVRRRYIGLRLLLPLHGDARDERAESPKLDAHNAPSSGHNEVVNEEVFPLLLIFSRGGSPAAHLSRIYTHWHPYLSGISR